jgi:hypothetical protein
MVLSRGGLYHHQETILHLLWRNTVRAITSSGFLTFCPSFASKLGHHSTGSVRLDISGNPRSYNYRAHYRSLSWPTEDISPKYWRKGLGPRASPARSRVLKEKQLAGHRTFRDKGPEPRANSSSGAWLPSTKSQQIPCQVRLMIWIVASLFRGGSDCCMAAGQVLSVRHLRGFGRDRRPVAIPRTS